MSATGVPVAVALHGTIGREVEAFVEAELEWQVVDADGPVRPVAVLAGDVVDGMRTVVVTGAPVAPAFLQRAFRAGAVDVIAWPHERERLRCLAVLPAHAAERSAGVLGIAGSRGGVGTSTVALAVGATVAWSRGRALVIGDDDLLRLCGVGAWRGPGSAELAALGHHSADEVQRLARPVPGVPGLHVLGGGGVVTGTWNWPFDLVVVDHGRRLDGAGVVVAAADAALAAVPANVRTLVVQHGPLDAAGVRALLGRAPAGFLPHSARVGRAGSAGRVPSALPGSWVQRLRQGLARAC